MKIRKALADDAVLIAPLLMQAMEGIVYELIGVKDYEQGVKFLHYFIEKENNQYSFQNCHVIEVDGSVAGVINIYDGANLEELRAPIAQHIEDVYKKVFRAEDETLAGEMYIDTFGVRSDMQGRGLGKSLLHYVIQAYAIKGGHVLGLLVDDKNPRAKKMYLQLGFQEVGMKMLLGTLLHHLQYRKV